MIQVALESRKFFLTIKHPGWDGDQEGFDIRIGINTGPLVAGVVGSKKFSYDIWGDTVNVTARMETMSETGKINISENTYVLIREKYDCVPRGAIRVKNRGRIKMYFVLDGKEDIKNRIPSAFAIP